jgi:hypothetical protein
MTRQSKEMSASQRAAYKIGRTDERKRWARNLRRWLAEGSDDHTLTASVWVDAVLDKVCELAKTPRKRFKNKEN